MKWIGLDSGGTVTDLILVDGEAGRITADKGSIDVDDARMRSSKS